MNPISVVIPCYNTGQYLAEAVQSVLRQIRPAAEIIMVDDGSTDAKTLRLLNQFEQQGLIVHHTPNRGAAAARNYGVGLAKNPYVLCFDSDDVLLPAFLAETAQRLDESSEVGVVATHLEFFGPRASTYRPPDYAPSRMLWQNCLPGPSLFRRQCWEEVGGYKNMKASEDWEFWLSVTVERGWKWLVVPEVLYRYRQRPGSVSSYCEANRPELMQQLVQFHQATYQSQLVKILVELNSPSQAASNGVSHPSLAHTPALPELGKALTAVQQRSPVPPQNQGTNQKHAKLRQIIQATIPREAIVLVTRDKPDAAIELGCDNTWFFPPNDNVADGETIALLEEMRGQGAGFLVIIPPVSAWLAKRPELQRHLLQRYRVCGRIEDSGLIFDLRQEMQPHTFSVVICTYKREKHIGQAIEWVFAQNYPKDQYELIVVNNDSPDNTEAVIRRCAGHAPVAFSSYIEKRNGLSFARNLGAEKARHEYIVFLDDDAAAGPDWLANFNAVINEHHALVVGGRIDETFAPDFTPPAWFNYPYLRGFFGLNYRARKESVFRVRSPLYLGGGNSAYAKRIFDHFRGFDARLGRDDKSLAAGEETLLNLMLERNDVPMFYSDGAYIDHFVDASRLTKSHLRRKTYWAGVSNAIIQSLFFGDADTRSKTKSNWKEIRDKLRAIWRQPRHPENFSHLSRIIYNLAFLQKFYRLDLAHRLKGKRHVPPAITWDSEHWLAEVSRWPEGPDKYRELYHYHLFREDKENAQKTLRDLAAYLGNDDLAQVEALLESNKNMNQRHHYNALKQQIRQVVDAHLPAQANVLVVSRGDKELLQFEGPALRGWHFPQNGKNVYAGYYPATSAEAVAHLETLRARGADFLLFPRPAFWWLEHYADFKTHLKSRYELVLNSQDACLIYDLRKV